MSKVLRHDFTQTDLIRYFYPKIFTLAALNPNVLDRGLACTASARLIVLDFGGPEKARIYWVKPDSHAYVVKNDQKDTEFAYNNSGRRKRKVGFVKQYEDKTEEYFKESWSRLDLK